MDKHLKLSKKYDNTEIRSVSSTLIVVGSTTVEHARSIEYYDHELDKWNKLLELDVDRYEFQSLMLEGKLMIVGGYNTEVLPTVESYDFDTATLTTLAPMKNPRRRLGIAVFARHLFAIGGYGERYLNEVERYNPSTNEWTDVKPMPTPRYDFGVAINGVEIYAIGGNSFGASAVVESYNPILGTWKSRASMNEIRDEPAVASVGNFIYAVCGLDTQSALDTVERYDTQVDKWSYLETVNIPRHMCAAINFNGSVIVAGGYLTSNIETDLVESFNGEWTTKAPLATPRAHFSLVEVPLSFLKNQQKSKL